MEGRRGGGPHHPVDISPINASGFIVSGQANKKPTVATDAVPWYYKTVTARNAYCNSFPGVKQVRRKLPSDLLSPSIQGAEEDPPPLPPFLSLLIK